MDFSVEEEFNEKLSAATLLVKEKIEPLETLGLSFQKLLKAIEPLRAEVRELGLYAPHIPRKFGGSLTSQVHLALLNEVLGRSFLAPIVFNAHAPDAGNAELLAVALEEQDSEVWRQYLKLLVDGSCFSAFAMTEPEVAGSDPTLLRTRAVYDKGIWRITGHKWFITHGSFAEFFLVMARTEEEGDPRKSFSIFLVPASQEGIKVVRDVPTMEDLPSPEGGFGTHAELVLEDVTVPEDHLVGKRGEGFRLAQARLGPGRIQHCMRWVGQCKRAFEMMLERAASRYSHGSLLKDKGMIQDMVASAYAEIEAFRLMTLYCAWVIDQRGSSGARTEISALKFYGARVLNDVIDRAIQVHGALGFSADMPLQAMYRAARAARIYDGADEVHKEVVARRLLSQVEPREVPSEHIPTRRQKALEMYREYL